MWKGKFNSKQSNMDRQNIILRVGGIFVAAIDQITRDTLALCQNAIR